MKSLLKIYLGILVPVMTNFAGKCFFSNIILTQMKFELIVKFHVLAGLR